MALKRYIIPKMALSFETSKNSTQSLENTQTYLISFLPNPTTSKNMSLSTTPSLTGSDFFTGDSKTLPEIRSFVRFIRRYLIRRRLCRKIGFIRRLRRNLERLCWNPLYSGTSTLALVARASAFGLVLIYRNIKLKALKENGRFVSNRCQTANASVQYRTRAKFK
ncbi:uncharacterized protein LOC9319742 isoform X3 [Arabidopsis lyrata subsp. lyrata]|uniref:uncharacterized protein LOC9319742 isoform X3 n=1 Tax=Arabidopsis lyrata subsp. lyrata TaxID=81972 RepID=UPI000A29AE5F|nr:uncharacterized protein LOC9319742 isoform X3 [Arabidopsis lyrata subsp. lyrata]|eukprot:XP_020886027.1 uncharacterized protein LOC9319742 isoform X3 [Arabidopsis lyrata subsp. lyrata]